MKLNFNREKIKISIIILCVIVLIHGLIGGISLKALLNVTALQIIFTGLFIACLIGFPLEVLIDTFKMIKASLTKKMDYSAVVFRVYNLAVKVKREGVLSIEGDIQNEKNIFLRDAMVLLNDYKKPEVISDILDKDMEARKANLYKSYNVIKMIAYVAPSLGLIGTLVGLIGLLGSIDQPYLIMDNMASALVSTLYGSMIASFVAMPLMVRMQNYIDKILLQYEIITEGVLLIAKNDTARNVFDKMNVMLKEEERLLYPGKKRGTIETIESETFGDFLRG
ncbi:MotA/TolQ/ExbB proton channel family protein [Serpentinicella sp. ANB-PHB4]|uniref:motility protein A n=1 Tax=Serpentinicella sp. ANB-PHB4 TaxID=3074076 RepID=UPI0028652BC5|nr:MotA/TolQ/ExbB proton channel family protein [Serpentinicella sp. ANB-PHB4]MDR5659296.1 MotA/TolQ/ExbB proton channel family protein [Serpentinicella sp. ANB-PHB4]